MKKIICILLITGAVSANAQIRQLEKLWETDTTIAVPESVLPDVATGTMYISLIDGGGWDADGKGGVGKLSFDGKQYDGNWISGLNAPKGMGIAGNLLYVADINEVVVIDITNGKVEQKIMLDSAKGLNDITVDSKGTVYVSDSRTGKIWRIKNNKPVVYLENQQGVNGLKAIGNDLYIGAGKNFVKADKNKNITKVAELPQGIDGIEPVGNGDFILTSWPGYIFYVTANGNVQTLLETYQQKKNTADIGYDAKTKTLYVPTFNGKQIVAYSLK